MIETDVSPERFVQSIRAVRLVSGNVHLLELSNQTALQHIHLFCWFPKTHQDQNLTQNRVWLTFGDLEDDEL